MSIKETLKAVKKSLVGEDPCQNKPEMLFGEEATEIARLSREGKNKRYAVGRLMGDPGYPKIEIIKQD